MARYAVKITDTDKLSSIATQRQKEEPGLVESIFNTVVDYIPAAKIAKSIVKDVQNLGNSISALKLGFEQAQEFNPTDLLEEAEGIASKRISNIEAKLPEGIKLFENDQQRDTSIKLLANSITNLDFPGSDINPELNERLRDTIGTSSFMTSGDLQKKISSLQSEFPNAGIHNINLVELNNEYAARLQRTEDNNNKRSEQVFGAENEDGGVLARGAQLTGSIVGFASDPINAISMLVSPAKGATIGGIALKTSVKLGLAEAAVQATAQPLRAHKTTEEKIIEGSIVALTAGVVGGGLHAAGVAAVKGYRNLTKLKSVKPIIEGIEQLDVEKVAKKAKTKVNIDEAKALRDQMVEELEHVEAIKQSPSSKEQMVEALKETVEGIKAPKRVDKALREAPEWQIDPKGLQDDSPLKEALRKRFNEFSLGERESFIRKPEDINADFLQKASRDPFEEEMVADFLDFPGTESIAPDELDAITREFGDAFRENLYFKKEKDLATLAVNQADGIDAGVAKEFQQVRTDFLAQSDELAKANKRIDKIFDTKKPAEEIELKNIIETPENERIFEIDTNDLGKLADDILDINDPDKTLTASGFKSKIKAVTKQLQELKDCTIRAKE
jgi:hypothetical protein